MVRSRKFIRLQAMKNPVFAKITKSNMFTAILILLFGQQQLIGQQNTQPKSAIDSFFSKANELKNDFVRGYKNAAQSEPSHTLSPEEIGYLNIFGDLNYSARDSAIGIIMGEPPERLIALNKLKSLHKDWMALLKSTLPPESMVESGRNQRDELMKLLEASHISKTPEQIENQCVKFLKTRGNFNHYLKTRQNKPPQVPKDKRVSFVIRPLGNPLFVYGGEAGKGEFKVSLGIPTPAGYVVINEEEVENTVRYLVVQYKGVRRIFSLNGISQTQVEVVDEKIYAVKTETSGSFIFVTISARE